MLHILLAEDNPGDVLLIQQALIEHHVDHQLYTAHDGAEALKMIDRIGLPGGMPCPDLILLDLNLPKVDGASVLRALRTQHHCARIPVIIVTSSDAQRDRALVAELGVSRYFRKPLDFDAFLRLGAVVREVVEGAVA